MNYQNINQQPKRKNDSAFIEEKVATAAKRLHISTATTTMSSQQQFITAANFLPPLEDPMMVDESQLPPRPTTPPLGMTLSHYDSTTGSYTSSQLNSDHEVSDRICTGMTPVYRAPFERWGSCLI